MPVQSPVMCAAIYAKKYMKITDKLAFISSCIAKKSEISDPNNQGYITYNVTFDHLLAYVRKNNVKGEAVLDEIEYGLGSIYPMPGGLKISFMKSNTLRNPARKLHREVTGIRMKLQQQ